MDEYNFVGILSTAVKSNSSDIIFIPGQKPTLRAFNNLIELATENLKAEDTNWIAEHITRGRGIDWAKFMEGEFSYEEKGSARFRVSICQSQYNKIVVMRVIPKQNRTISELNLPAQIADLANLKHGLVLVTGEAGQGKSTTAAAIVEEINQNRRAFILTIEDPIEFIYEPNQALIGQREIGEDVNNYKEGVSHVLRQNPNIVFIGEIRDPETFEAALTAAETGRLVFSTMNSPNVITTIDKIFRFYPEAERETLKFRLSNNLRAILSLKLLKRKVPNVDGKMPELFLIPACELMVSSPVIKNLIMLGSGVVEKFINIEGLHTLPIISDKSNQSNSEIINFLDIIKGVIDREGQTLLDDNAKMFSFDQYISSLLQQGEIEPETAKTFCANSN